MNMDTTTAKAKDKARGKARVKGSRKGSSRLAASAMGTGREIAPAIRAADHGMEPATGRSKEKEKRIRAAQPECD
jgi:hypothetical protein